MPDTDPPGRYSEAEAREILRRATEIEARPALPEPGGSMTLAELEAVAIQAGIDPAAVRQAALARIPPPTRSLGTALRGGPVVRVHRIILPGHLPPARHDELAATLDRVLRAQGVTQVGDGSFRWSEDHTQGRTRIEVRDRGGGSEVLVQVDRRGWAAALTLAALAGGVAVGVLLGMAVGPGLGALAGVTFAWGIVRAVWAPAARRLEGHLEAAVAEIAARLAAPGTE